MARKQKEGNMDETKKPDYRYISAVIKDNDKEGRTWASEAKLQAALAKVKADEEVQDALKRLRAAEWKRLTFWEKCKAVFWRKG